MQNDMAIIAAMRRLAFKFAAAAALNRRRLLAAKRYNPDQLRIPAGQGGGGRWTDAFANLPYRPGAGSLGDQRPAAGSIDQVQLATSFTNDQKLMTVGDFIAQNCAAGVNRVLPGQLRDLKIEKVLEMAKRGDAAARSCIKLLDRPEYRK